MQPYDIIQRPIRPSVDLRDMLRRHLIEIGIELLGRSERRRSEALASGDVLAYAQEVTETLRGLYDQWPTIGPDAPPPAATFVSSYEGNGFRVENVLFDSFPGWQVNASVYVPLNYEPPFPAVIVPVGHSGKQFENYQLPSQFFARCGYLVVLFDPPGQSSEKQEGNDHFRDGVRGYLVGQPSNRYFVGDALRCIDYVQTRPDVDISNGVAMTGVSGGGTTTNHAMHMDDRITVAAPSCCLAPAVDLVVRQCAAGDPEARIFGRYAKGIDDVDLVCARAPKPLLIMAGEQDEVFHIEDTRRLANEVEKAYLQAGVPERFQFYADAAGHCYSLRQARVFVEFANRWLLNDPERSIPELPPDTFEMAPYEKLRCYPSQEVNMRTLALSRAEELAAERQGQPVDLNAVSDVCAVAGKLTAPLAQEGERFQVWTHDWQPLLLTPEPGIELPATWVGSRRKTPGGVLLYLGDQGRHQPIYKNGILNEALDFLNRDRQEESLSYLGVDLRGWGDSTPGVYPYEMPWWAGIDRATAYLSNTYADPILGQRVRDGLAALDYLRTRPDADPAKIVLAGSGLGGVVALHVAAIDAQQGGAVAGVLTWDALVSFEALLRERGHEWPADAFVPNVLLSYDLPDLASALNCPVRMHRPLDGARQSLDAASLDALNKASAGVTYLSDATSAALAASAKALVGV